MAVNVRGALDLVEVKDVTGFKQKWTRGGRPLGVSDEDSHPRLDLPLFLPLPMRLHTHKRTHAHTQRHTHVKTQETSDKTLANQPSLVLLAVTTFCPSRGTVAVLLPPDV